MDVDEFAAHVTLIDARVLIYNGKFFGVTKHFH
jgi:hypothetical protein